MLLQIERRWPGYSEYIAAMTFLQNLPDYGKSISKFNGGQKLPRKKAQ